ncbi:hypothetical protein ACERIT_14250 [Halopenitus sp. H-Gu1]|uniref:hypothetical protein n=1 Tax=Halopenitus sp. H-Gu1 TaxID=3242697 RepID=UPI00359EE345
MTSIIEVRFPEGVSISPNTFARRRTTTFALDLALVGAILDATVITRQRRRKLDVQFDWLETTTA